MFIILTDSDILTFSTKRVFISSTRWQNGNDSSVLLELYESQSKTMTHLHHIEVLQVYQKHLEPQCNAHAQKNMHMPFLTHKLKFIKTECVVRM